jgi:hypothetical protein
MVDEGLRPGSALEEPPMTYSKFRIAALGALFGMVASVTLALPSLVPQTMADEPLKTMHEAKDAVLETVFGRGPEFVKPRWTIEDGVSTEVLRSSTVRKIEFGRTSFVTIATTSTGVYSSDGLDSPNIRYPGIHDNGRDGGFATLTMLSNGSWELVKELDAGSFVSVVPFEGGQMIVGNDGACAFVGKTVYC